MDKTFKKSRYEVLFSVTRFSCQIDSLSYLLFKKLSGASS